MNKLVCLITLAFVLGGCSEQSQKDITDDQSNAEPNVQQSEETKNSESTEVNEDKAGEKPVKNVDAKSEDKEQTNGSETSEKKGLIDYRPKVGSKKVFSQNNEFQITYHTIAANDKYVQRSISFGDSTTLQILEWNKDRISNVYQEQNPSDTSNQINSFKAYEPPINLLNVDKKGKGEGEEWEVISTNETVKVPYGQFTNVYVAQQTFVSDTTGDKTISKAFYAPETGLIKETTKVTGENGYEIITVLKSIHSN